MSQFCSDCKHRFGWLGESHCRASRKPYTDHVTGEEKLSSALYCFVHRMGPNCRDFAPKPPTLIQRLKEVFS